eukprot:5874369-Pyramimonas_sp.AAC.2
MTRADITYRCYSRALRMPPTGTVFCEGHANCNPIAESAKASAHSITDNKVVCNIASLVEQRYKRAAYII